ncbi:MAG: serine/threonine protein kinase [Polyangiaceae bacterium]|nr:serine/threonine protein kinase [Polyangiaceae bacterium]
MSNPDSVNLFAGARSIDGYDLVAEIACGGMATVYLARRVGVGGFQRLVALKTLHPHLAKQQSFVDMFLDEARLAANIHHPNVVSIEEIGMGDSGYYLVMDYIKGGTLAQLMSEDGPEITPAVLIHIMLDALNGLHGAHEARTEGGLVLGLVHRDVSPQNVLVGLDGISRIADFGVARASKRLTETAVGQLKGKIAYMSPEQALAQNVDRRADVFSAGIVLWEGLTRQRLFKGEHDAATLAQVLSYEVPDVNSVNPEIPAALSEVCMKALARQPGARFQTCQAFWKALSQAQRVSELETDAQAVGDYVSAQLATQILERDKAVRNWMAASGVTEIGAEAAAAKPDAGREMPTRRPKSRDPDAGRAPPIRISESHRRGGGAIGDSPPGSLRAGMRLSDRTPPRVSATPELNRALVALRQHYFGKDVKIDTTGRPIVVIRFPGNEFDVDTFLSGIDDMMTSSQRVVLLLDLRQARRPTAAARRRAVSFMEASKLFSGVKAAGLLVDGAAMRGAIKAIFWMVKPPTEIVVFGDAKAAGDWAEAQAERMELVRPAGLIERESQIPQLRE